MPIVDAIANKNSFNHIDNRFFLLFSRIVRCNSSQWSMLALCSITIESIKLSFLLLMLSAVVKCVYHISTSNRYVYVWLERANERGDIEMVEHLPLNSFVDTLNHRDAFASTWEIKISYNNSVYAFLWWNPITQCDEVMKFACPCAMSLAATRTHIGWIARMSLAMNERQ